MSRRVHEWRFEVGAPDHGNRLDAFLRARLRWRSRERIQRAITDQAVEVVRFKDLQGGPIGRLRASSRLRRGQEVIVRLPSPQMEIAGDPIAAGAALLVHEDDHLLAVSKPPHRNVYPSRRHRADSLIEWVHARHRAACGADGYFPTPCHRLDRETSGLVLFAKSRLVRSELSRLFETREVRKLYLAIVAGRPEQEEGVIDAPLGDDRSSAVEMKVAPRPDGLAARTRWRFLRALGDCSLLELEPGSGRRHQLRVHLATLGHPILGDKLYGVGGDEVFLRSLSGELSAADERALGLARQALHAWRLEFTLDRLGASYRLEAPLADDMARWIARHDKLEEPCPEAAVPG